MKKQRQSGKPHASVNFKANARRIPAAIKALKSHRLPVAAVCALNVTCFCNSFALFRCSNSSSSSSSPQLGFPIAKHNKKANEILSISVQSSSWPWMPRCPWAAPWVLMHFACNQIVLYFCFSSLLDYLLSLLCISSVQRKSKLNAFSTANWRWKLNSTRFRVASFNPVLVWSSLNI